MKRLFISQPMKGLTDEEILVVRDKAIKSVEGKLDEPVEVIDSFFQDAPADAKPLWYLAKSIELLATADVAYFVAGWENARGCKIENTCAVEYGVDVIEDYADSGECLVSFGAAIEALKAGVKMTRKGWNGKGLFVVYQKGYPDGIPCNKQTAAAWGMNEGDLFRCEPYLQINTVDGSHAMWVPSIRDVLAEDWVMVE